MDKNLLPCPRCNNEATISQKKLRNSVKVLFNVGCSDGRCIFWQPSLWKANLDEVIDQWNRRTAAPTPKGSGDYEIKVECILYKLLGYASVRYSSNKDCGLLQADIDMVNQIRAELLQSPPEVKANGLVPLSQDDLAKFLASYKGNEITLSGNMDIFAKNICEKFGTKPVKYPKRKGKDYLPNTPHNKSYAEGWNDCLSVFKTLNTESQGEGK